MHNRVQMEYNKICIHYTCQERLQFIGGPCELLQNTPHTITKLPPVCTTPNWQDSNRNMTFLTRQHSTCFLHLNGCVLWPMWSAVVTVMVLIIVLLLVNDYKASWNAMYVDVHWLIVWVAWAFELECVLIQCSPLCGCLQFPHAIVWNSLIPGIFLLLLLNKT